MTTGLSIREWRALAGKPKDVTDDWLVVIGRPDDSGEAYAITIGELRGLLRDDRPRVRHL